MDPLTTTLVTAFVIGATQAATKVGDQAVLDAYAALKNIAAGTYNYATELVRSITGLESNPNSSGRRQTLAEELQTLNAVDDEALIAAAEAVIAAAERSSNKETIGVDWQEVRVARLKVGQIRARAGAIGFRAAKMEVLDAEIVGIDVSGTLGK